MGDTGSLAGITDVVAVRGSRDEPLRHLLGSRDLPPVSHPVPAVGAVGNLEIALFVGWELRLLKRGGNLRGGRLHGDLLHDVDACVPTEMRGVTLVWHRDVHVARDVARVACGETTTRQNSVT